MRGGYFGARLAKSGCEVGFVARGAHLAAIRQNGLRVESQLGELYLPEVRASDDPAAFGTPGIRTEPVAINSRSRAALDFNVPFTNRLSS